MSEFKEGYDAAISDFQEAVRCNQQRGIAKNVSIPFTDWFHAIKHWRDKYIERFPEANIYPL